MIEKYGNIWESGASAICITTNGTVKDGKNIMGGGIAREAANRYPELPGIYGNDITQHGNNVYVYHLEENQYIICFPVKHEVWDKADPDLIFYSLGQLIQLQNIHQLDTIALPRPGCGLGGLEWDEMKPRLEKFIYGEGIEIWAYETEKPVDYAEAEISQTR